MEMAVFDQLLRAGPAAQEVVVEGKQQGVEATAVEEAAVVLLAGAPGGVGGRELTPAGAVGELPEDGVEQEPWRGVGATTVRLARWKWLFLEDGKRGEAAVFLEEAEGLAGPRGMLDEAPPVGSDEDGRDAAQVVGPGVDGDEGRERTPLR
jgi:hypothetical protein